MSISYEGGVFFGAFVERGTVIGEKLNEYTERHGGTPAPTKVHGVEVSTVGSDSERWVTVQAKGSLRVYGRDDGECPTPELLREDPRWHPALAAFLTSIGAPELPIGWHFQGSAS